MNAKAISAGTEPSEASFPDAEIGSCQAETVIDEQLDPSEADSADLVVAPLKQRFEQLKAELAPAAGAGKSSPNPPLPASPRRRSVRARPRWNSVSASGRAPAEPLNRAAHEAHCTICRHPERRAIEEEFIHWLSPWSIASEYEIARRAIYRHAHALDLFAVRDRKLRFALGHIIDEAERVSGVSGSAIVSAVHAFARVNSEGQWIEPPSHVIVSSGTRQPASRAPEFDETERPAPTSPKAKKQLKKSAPSLDTAGRVEHHAND